jgi:hypothetical protein
MKAEAKTPVTNTDVQKAMPSTKRRPRARRVDGHSLDAVVKR